MICVRSRIKARDAKRAKGTAPPANDALYSMDLIGPIPADHEGYTYVLVVVKNSSRLGAVRLLRNKRAETVLKNFQDMLRSDFAGLPITVVHSDGGTEFQGEFDAFLRENRITHTLSAPYRPQANSIVERRNWEPTQRTRALLL